MASSWTRTETSSAPPAAAKRVLGWCIGSVLKPEDFEVPIRGGSEIHCQVCARLCRGGVGLKMSESARGTLFRLLTISATLLAAAVSGIGAAQAGKLKTIASFCAEQFC